MKKHSIILLTSVIFVTTFASIKFFMPEKVSLGAKNTPITSQSYSDNQAQRIEDKTSSLDFIGFKTYPEAYSKKDSDSNNNNIVKKLSDYIHNFELAGAHTHSILTANDEQTQNYIQEFSERVETDILDNSNISSEQKQTLLWSLYNETGWRGDDNAFKAVLSDALLSIDLSYVLPEIMSVYQQSLHEGDKDIAERSNVIRIIANNFESNIDSVNQLYLQQIELATTEEEIQELSEHCLMRYIEDNTVAVLQKNIDHIITIADTDELKASLYIETMLVSSINAQKNTDVVFEKLLNNPLGSFAQKALHDTLLFQLSDDRNFELVDIKPHNLEKIKNYISKENLSGNDWDVVNKRINQILQNNKQ